MAAPTPKAPGDPQAAQDSSGRQRNAGDELADALTALEAEVEELKAKYEMYFLGVELREPAKWREEVKKKVLRLKEAFTRNTGLRFRVQTLHARFLSYERLWLRSAREREEGTYRRDLFKARLHGRGKAAAARPGAGGKPMAPAHEHHEGGDVDLSDFHDDAPEPTPVAAAPRPPAGAPVQAPTARPAGATTAPAAAAPRPPVAPPGPKAPAPIAAPKAPATPAARPAPAAAAAPARLAEAQMRELYDAYVTAKRRCNEDTSRLTYDAVAQSVSKQIPEIMKQHKAKSVEFKVVIKDGKAKLTAVPKT